MSQFNFDQDLYFEDNPRSQFWVKDSTPIDLIEFYLNKPFGPFLYHEQALQTEANTLETMRNYEILTQSSITQISVQEQPNSDTPNPADDNHFKSKKIFKYQKHSKLNSDQQKKQTNNRKPSTISSTRPKSKFNNMGGFLISTFAEILQQNFCYKIDNGCQLLFLNGNWSLSEKLEIHDFFEVQNSVTELKEKIFKLPRKEGAKKHLFDLINNQKESDSQTTKISKAILRKEIVLGLSKDFWLLEHVQSRDFKPENDDFLGTKKQQRHEDYLAYLKAIKHSLVTNERLPKRIHV